MRLAFGVVSLLVTMAIIVWLFSLSMGGMSKPATKTREQAQTWSGKTEDGVVVSDTYALTANTQADGKFDGLVVTNFSPDSPLKKFGVQANDIIIAGVDNHMVPWDALHDTDERSARDHVFEACTLGGKLIIMRGNAKYTLASGETPVPFAGSPAAVSGQPATPTNTAPPEDNDPMKEINRRLHPIGGM